MDSLWNLVKELNKARYNKQALDASLAEESAGVAFLEMVNEKLEEALQRQLRSPNASPVPGSSPASISSSFSFDQSTAIRMVEACVEDIYAEIDALQKAPRNQYGTLSEAMGDAIDSRTQLISELSAVIGRREVDAMLASSRQQVNAVSALDTDGELDAAEKAHRDVERLESHITQKRQACRTWVSEIDDLRRKTTQIDLEIKNLELECSSIESELQMSDSRSLIEAEIAALEKSIETLLSLVAVPLAALRLK